MSENTQIGNNNNYQVTVNSEDPRDWVRSVKTSKIVLRVGEFEYKEQSRKLAYELSRRFRLDARQAETYVADLVDQGSIVLVAGPYDGVNCTFRWRPLMDSLSK